MKYFGGVLVLLCHIVAISAQRPTTGGRDTSSPTNQIPQPERTKAPNSSPTGRTKGPTFKQDSDRTKPPTLDPRTRTPTSPTNEATYRPTIVRPGRDDIDRSNLPKTEVSTQMLSSFENALEDWQISLLDDKYCENFIESSTVEYDEVVCTTEMIELDDDTIQRRSGRSGRSGFRGVFYLSTAKGVINEKYVEPQVDGVKMLNGIISDPELIDKVFESDAVGYIEDIETEVVHDVMGDTNSPTLPTLSPTLTWRPTLNNFTRQPTTWRPTLGPNESSGPTTWRPTLNNFTRQPTTWRPTLGPNDSSGPTTWRPTLNDDTRKPTTWRPTSGPTTWRPTLNDDTRKPTTWRPTLSINTTTTTTTTTPANIGRAGRAGRASCDPLECMSCAGGLEKHPCDKDVFNKPVEDPSGCQRGHECVNDQCIASETTTECGLCGNFNGVIVECEEPLVCKEIPELGLSYCVDV